LLGAFVQAPLTSTFPYKNVIDIPPKILKASRNEGPTHGGDHGYPSRTTEGLPPTHCFVNAGTFSFRRDRRCGLGGEGAIITEGRPGATPWPSSGKEPFLCPDVDASITFLALLMVGDFIDLFDFGMPSASHLRLVTRRSSLAAYKDKFIKVNNDKFVKGATVVEGGFLKYILL
jgi:hypothetical protein